MGAIRIRQVLANLNVNAREAVIKLKVIAGEEIVSLESRQTRIATGKISSITRQHMDKSAASNVRF